MNSIIKTISSIAIVGALSGLAIQASAATVEAVTTPELPSSTIDVAEFNVNSAAGVEQLYQRIRAAARWVCTEEHNNWWNNARTSHRNRCIDTAVEQAVATANLPMLTAVHRGTADSELVASR